MPLMPADDIAPTPSGAGAIVMYAPPTPAPLHTPRFDAITARSLQAGTGARHDPPILVRADREVGKAGKGK